MGDILKVNDVTYINLDAILKATYALYLVYRDEHIEPSISVWFLGNTTASAWEGKDAELIKEALDLRAHKDTMARSRETMADLGIAYPNEEIR